MGTPYIGEIRIFGGNFAPVGWEFCSGQLLPISENDALFTLIGTTYGGDGQSTFALPDLRGRLPLHQGQGPGLTNRVIGESDGVESVTVSVNQMPSHSHAPVGTTGPGGSSDPAGAIWATSTSGVFYTSGQPSAQLSPDAIGPAGGSQPHDNMQPYLCLSFIISLYGVFPTQS